ncbi:MAG: four helix bundle protein [Deltaproteobacteria bacterium]|nr:four helix bundle protein [Deltaproteobacteria bacterium]
MPTTKSKSRLYHDLEVWKLSPDLLRGVYLTNKFPASENFGLTNQIRRVANELE